MGDHSLHAVVKTFDVYPHNAVEVFFGCTFDGSDVRDAGVVDENMNCAVFPGERVKYALYLSLVGDITGICRCLSTRRLDLSASCFAGIGADVEDADCGAICGELEADCLPDAAASAGYDGYSSAEAELARIAFPVGQSETPRFQGMKSF